NFEALFKPIERCHFFAADLKNKHKGIFGLHALFTQIKQQRPIDGLADLHQVLRSQIIRFFARLYRIPIATIDKGRIGKKQLVAKEHKVLTQQATSFERYASVFAELGFAIQLSKTTAPYQRYQLPEKSVRFFNNHPVIGIAPFAQHDEKMYPLAQMKKVIEQLSELPVEVLLLGGGQKEKEILQTWEREWNKPNIHTIAGQFSLSEELAIISNLKIMVSMDSANMHLASLFGVPTVSIWGATHPYAGFYGWAQDPKLAISLPMSCRPCSVFGNKPCHRGDHACMVQIKPETIVAKIQSIL
ncbi:MAG: hypothetical protein RLY16_2396, partial [Bacteroidota bacterium]